ncbi:MAG: exodeoxyribonuclease VII large subunit [Ignavibacteria bacterium]|nr:exodeoxyribonuclease VII large subunit [Ignavibacteria bacterium]
MKEALRVSGVVLTVSEITRAIKGLLEERIGAVQVSGEISNLTRHSSGHLYFTLKDRGAQMSAVMFRGHAMSMFFRPENGMEVICGGSVTVYEPRGNYQIVVSEMLPRGEGALQVAFEALKRRLHDEGLFDAARKRRLPAFPRVIALVTSPTGAAVRDLVSVIRRRNATVRIILVPVQVQGAGAAQDISDAVDRCNAFGGIDVLIVARGGGSIEDLWAFNEERVARAIARSSIPVVSAIGHEVDFTIADFVADLRAATPSVAAEIVVPDAADLAAMVADISTALWKSVNSRMKRNWLRLSALSGSRVLARPLDRLLPLMQSLDTSMTAVQDAAALRLERTASTLEVARHRILAHDPARILRKGYTAVTMDGRPVPSTGMLRPGDRVRLRFHDGEATASIEDIDE